MLAAALVAGGGPAALAASSPSLTQAQQQESAVASQLATAQQNYDADLARWDAAVRRLDAANTALSQGARNLSWLTAQHSAALQALARDQAAVTQQEQVVAADQQRADQGLLAIQRNGTVSFLNVLLGANTFSDFLTRLSFLQSLWTVEMGWLQQARTAQAKLQTLEAQQQNEVLYLGNLQAQAAAQVVVLNTDAQEASAAQAAANAAMAAANGVVQQLLTEKNGLLAKIRAILAALESGSASWSQVLADINALAAQFGISPALVEAVVLQESGGNSAAKSYAGAEGLMQLMPSTASALGVTNAYDPVQNLTGGITYLLEQLRNFHGNLVDALAAYNAGPYAVKQYGGIPPYTQTQNYVRDVLALYNEGK